MIKKAERNVVIGVAAIVSFCCCAAILCAKGIGVVIVQMVYGGNLSARNEDTADLVAAVVMGVALATLILSFWVAEKICFNNSYRQEALDYEDS